MSDNKTDNDRAWEILNLIFRDGDFYISTEFQHPDVNDGLPQRFLCIDGTDHNVTDEQIEWIAKTFWTEDA